MRILVVDNDEGMRMFMQVHLEEKKHQVCLAKDGLDALRVLKDFLPDVMFIDLIMPNIDGKKLCQTRWVLM